MLFANNSFKMVHIYKNPGFVINRGAWQPSHLSLTSKWGTAKPEMITKTGNN
jgi:hypothetical protein